MQLIKDTIVNVKKLAHRFQDLQKNVKKLQASLPAVNEFQAEITTAVEKWQFKDQHRLEQIQKITEKLNQHLK